MKPSLPAFPSGRRLLALLLACAMSLSMAAANVQADSYDERRVRAGARLLQLYTGLIYEGPAVVSRIVGGLSARLARDGCSTVQEVVGIDVR